MNSTQNKKAILALTISGLLFATSTASLHATEAPVSANISIASDYVWRGVSQTLENPAISGGFDWVPAENFYVGVWGSNVDFDAVENMEFDVYGGWTTELDNGLGIDLGFIQYLYFDDTNDVDFNELYAGVSHSGFSGMVSYDPDNKSGYYDLGYEYELDSGISLSAHYGIYDLDGLENYSDYSVGAAASFASLDYGLSYYDTDIDGLAEADSRVVLSISRAF